MTRASRAFTVLIALFVAASLAAPDAGNAANATVPTIDAAGLAPAPAGPTAALLMDVRTGRVLYSREIHRRLPPASTTKILTAVVVLEALSPQAPVSVSRSAAAVRTGSMIGLEAGQTWSVSDLLHALLMRSANDAAVALAEATAGSVARFAVMMNARARTIGARSSHFANPSGLDDRGHYTTAHELGIITRHALRDPRFAAIVRARSWTLRRPGAPPQEIVNTNQLLATYEGADGVKTGQTLAAGYTFAASATRDRWQLLAVVLKSQDMYGDAGRLLDYGFEHFVPRSVARRGIAVASLPMGRYKERLMATVSQDVLIVTRRNAVVSSRIVWRSGLRPPIEAGTAVGAVQFLEGKSVVATAPLVAANRVAR